MLSGVVPAKLLEDLGLAMALHIDAGEGPLLAAPTVAAQLARCDDPARAAELAQFVRNLDAEFARILEDTPQEDLAAVRRELAISVHPVQVASKLWLIDELGTRVDVEKASLLILGGWYGVLPLLVNWRVPAVPREMICVDIDASACAAGERMIGSLFSNLEYRCADVMAISYDSPGDNPGRVIVNTICEHLPDVGAWLGLLPKGQLVVLQSNNLDSCPDHVSWVPGVQEFAAQTRLAEVLFEGTLHFPELDRFMLIGYT